ncbi:COPII subunit [Gaertneriomyces sp. JEL0708]|nr:COPII subunit [Gaertneriomyces sp. JEL0708]
MSGPPPSQYGVPPQQQQQQQQQQPYRPQQPPMSNMAPPNQQQPGPNFRPQMTPAMRPGMPQQPPGPGYASGPPSRAATPQGFPPQRPNVPGGQQGLPPQIQQPSIRPPQPGQVGPQGPRSAGSPNPAMQQTLPPMLQRPPSAQPRVPSPFRPPGGGQTPVSPGMPPPPGGHPGMPPTGMPQHPQPNQQQHQQAMADPRLGPNYIPPVTGTPPPPGPGSAPPGSRAGRRAYPTSDPYANPPSASAYGAPVDPFTAQRPMTPAGGVAPQGAQAPHQAPQFFSPADGVQGGAGVPSFGSPANVPTFGGAQQQQQHGQPQQPGMAPGPGGLNPVQQFQLGTASPYGSPFASPYTSQADIAQVSGQMSNMNLSQSHSQGPIPVNLLQVPPDPIALEADAPQHWLSNEAAVSRSPMANAPAKYKRCTLNAVPQTPQMLSKIKLPFGLLVTPYRHLLEGDDEVPVINPPQIVRCRRCRTYINPWVQFADQGTRWKCNLCYLTNEMPTFFDWDPETRQHVNRLERPELTHSVVEFIAPQEYMVRPPQPVVMLFVIDVSYPAVRSGMVGTAARTILDSLDQIPNIDNRTKVGFITVDTNLHFYNLNPNLQDPQMLVVSDLDDTFLPMPYDLLVSLTESRHVIETLLQRIPEMFKNTTVVGNVLGRALQAAHKMISPIGGKIVVLQASLPTGEGALKPREDVKLLGTPKEVQLLQPQSGFYKNLAVACSPTQVSMDLFLMGGEYVDVATLSGCAKFTGGSVYYYPSFTAARSEDALKFAHEFSHFLSRPIGLEAVMRIRASKGIKMTAFHGNFFLRSTDLLSLPSVNPDASFAVECVVQENLTGGVACFQTALLHTSSSGERRIRVITLAVPVTANMGDVISSCDQYALATLLAKKAVERALTSKLEDARDALLHKLDEIITAYKQEFLTTGQSGQLVLPANLAMLPVLTLGMLKHLAFRGSANVPSDLRSYVLALMYVLPPEVVLRALYPRFWALHSMDKACGLPGENGRIVFPPTLNANSERIERHGIYLMENGTEIFLWIGRQVQPELVQMLFDRPSYDAVIAGKATLPVLNNPFSTRVQNLVGKLREQRLLQITCYPNLYVVKEDCDPGLRMMMLGGLVEDRVEGVWSYAQFLGVLRDRTLKG